MEKKAYTRINWVDIFKGILIILMVFGHTNGWYTKYIYMFHISAFFIISGFTTNYDKDDFVSYFIKKFKGIMIPFLAVNIGFIFFNLLLDKLGFLHYFSDNPFNFSLFLNFIKYYWTPNLGGATWFLLVLFMSSVCGKLLNDILKKTICSENEKYINIYRFIASFSFMILIYYLFNKSHDNLMYSIDLVPMALFYITLGYLIRKILFEKGKIIRISSIIISMIVYIYFIFFKDVSVDWVSRNFPRFIYFTLLSLSGFFLLYAISIILEKLKKYEGFLYFANILEYFGKNTISILLYHFLGFRIAFILLYKLKIADITLLKSQVITLYNAPYTVSVVLFAVLFSIIFSNIIKFIIKCIKKIPAIFMNLKKNQMDVTKMNLNKDGKININLLFYIFTYICILVLFIDYLTFFLNLNYLLEIFISLFFTTTIFYLTRKLVKIDNTFEKNDIFFFIFLICVFIITIVYPDRCYDTLNYHIYNQISPFSNKIGSDFFPSSIIQSFSYAYPDRIFYLFRYFLGYRLGLILNYFIIIILYYQIKKIFNKFFNQNSLFVNIASTFIALSLSVLDIMDSYYIDLISLVLLLELFSQSLFMKKLDGNSSSNRIIICYLAIIAGLTFAVKISNMFFVILFAIIYLIRNKENLKKIKIIDYILFVILFIIPVFLYIYNTYIQTGNPVFPFYNTIFHSKFYPNVNWFDARFGPKNFVEIITWPIFVLFNPNRAYDLGYIEPILTFGYIVSIFVIISCILKKLLHKEYDKNILVFSIICIFVNIIWSKFVLGYIRYGLIVLVINSIITYLFVYRSFKNKKIILVSILSICLLYNFGYCFKTYVYNSAFYSYNNYYANPKSYEYNLGKIFSKNNFHIDFPKNSVWISIFSESGNAKLLNDEMPIIYLKNSENSAITDKRNELLKNVEHIYAAVDFVSISDFIRLLESTDYSILNLYSICNPDFTEYNNFIYIFELTKTTSTKEFYIGTNYNEVIQNDFEEFNLFFGLSGTMIGIDFSNYTIELIVNDTVTDYYKLKTNDFDLVHLKYYKEDEINTIKLNVIDNDGNRIDWPQLMVISEYK